MNFASMAGGAIIEICDGIILSNSAEYYQRKKCIEKSLRWLLGFKWFHLQVCLNDSMDDKFDRFSKNTQDSF